MTDQATKTEALTASAQAGGGELQNVRLVFNADVLLLLYARLNARKERRRRNPRTARANYQV
jgi:hypothetical protein